ARRLPAAGGRLLRRRAVPRLLRQPAAGAGPGRPRVGGVTGLRPAAGEDRRDDVPGARARAVPGALPRPDRDVGGGRESGALALTGGVTGGVTGAGPDRRASRPGPSRPRARAA